MKQLFVIVLVFVAFHTRGQIVNINVNIPACRDSQVVVANYYFGGLYVKDTLQLDLNGNASYTGNEALPQGIYQLFLSQDVHYDFLVGQDQQFSLTVSPNGNKLLVKQAAETEKFQQYIDYLAQQKAKYRKLSTQLERVKQNPDSVKLLKKQIGQLDTDVRKYRFDEGMKNQNNLFGKVLLAGHQVEPDAARIPKAIQANDSLKWVYEYNFRKQHYWDYFNLGDLRLWRTPFAKERLEDYFNKVLLQSPDSVLPEAIRLIEKYRDNSEIFQNLTSFLVNNSIQSKMMGMENVFVALAKRYYLSGQANWADEKTLENMRREVGFRQNNLLGNEAPELLLEDAQGEFHSLHQCATPYTLLAFWEPGCSHCKKEIPRLYEEIFLPASPSQLSICAVYTMTDQSEWQDFVREYELNDWQNLWDPKQISDMKVLYGVRTTPSLFLLDKDKKIVAKNLDVAGMKHMLKVLNVLQ